LPAVISLLELYFMPTESHFSLNHRIHLPRLEPRSEARDRAATLWRILKRGFLIALVTAFGSVVLSVENTAKFLVDVTASLVDGSARQPRTNQPELISQSSSDSATFAIAKHESIDGEGAASEPAEQNRGEIPEPTPEILFRQFQAWAAEKDAQRLATVQPPQDSSPPQTAPTRAVEETAGFIGFGKKDRHVQRIRNARTQVAKQDSRKEIRRPQNPQVQVPLARGTGAQVSRN
jgi:hypothetical protein